MSGKARKTIKLAIIGADGRMGQEILALAKADPAFEVAVEIDRKRGFPKKGDGIDLAIEFSTPEGCEDALNWCVGNKIALVSGTTGLSPATLKKLQASAKKIPLLYSANMSLGIAVMSAMMEQFAAIRDWDYQIEEAHHNQKKDRPSGTALLLEERLSSVLKRKLPPTNVIRGGGIPGIHQVWAMGPEETLTLQHTAFHRRVFARGALKAARWLFDKAQPGLYDLSDLYKVN